MSESTPNPTDVAQNKAITRLSWMLGFLILVILCLIGLILTGPIQNPIQTQPLWNVPVTMTATPTAEAANTEIAPTIAFTEAPPSTSTLAPVFTATPTSTPIVVTINNRALLIGGRLDQDGVYCMYSAEIATSLLEDGTALQQYHEQLTEDGFDNSCNLDAKLEDLNDGVKIVVTDGRAYFMPEDGDVPHSSISWIQYDPNKGILICHDDSGTAGSWDGACKGKKVWVTEWISYDDLLTSSKFQPWAEPFAQIEHLFDGKIFNGKIEILEVHN